MIVNAELAQECYVGFQFTSLERFDIIFSIMVENSFCSTRATEIGGILFSQLHPGRRNKICNFDVQ